MALILVAAPEALAAPRSPAPPVDTSPVVTPDPTPPPIGAAAPTGTVTMAPEGDHASAGGSDMIPVGGRGAERPPGPAAPAAAPAAPPEPPEPAVFVRAEACLRANVDRVVRAEPSPKAAVDLLLTDVCAATVDAASLYVRNSEALARYNPESERGRAGLSTAEVDPDTGRIVNPPNVDVTSALAADGLLAIAGPTAPQLREYAAALVLTERARPAAPPKKSR